MQESNQSKLIEKGWADYGLRADAAEQERMIKEAVAKHIEEMNKKNGAKPGTGNKGKSF
jgi:predicted DNA-binding transcriptional regulator